VRGRGGVVPLRAEHEHALVVLDGSVAVGGNVLAPGQLGYLGLDRDELPIDVAAGDTARVLLLGGVPFPEPLLMWWNYVARTRDEIVAAHTAWTARDDRFGPVASPLAAIDTSGPPWGR
jgi:redox-sensitive bicupin YhaK (pirin superfamily)